MSLSDAAHSVFSQTKGLRIGGYQQPAGGELLMEDGDGEETCKLDWDVEPASSYVMWKTATENVMEVYEIFQKLVQVSSILCSWSTRGIIHTSGKFKSYYSFLYQ